MKAIADYHNHQQPQPYPLGNLASLVIGIIVISQCQTTLTYVDWNQCDQ